MRATPRLHAVVLAAVAALVLSACGGGSGGEESDETAGNDPVKGGTLSFLTIQEQIQHLDPQRNYYGEDLAFTSAFLTRTLTAYSSAPTARTANGLVPDLATDTGHAPTRTRRRGRWTLKDGADVARTARRSPARTSSTACPARSPPTSSPTARSTPCPASTSRRPRTALGLPGPLRHQGQRQRSLRQGRRLRRPQDDHVPPDRPVPDFNYTVTLSAFAPVPKAADTGEDYDDKPVSSGPYKIQEYDAGNSSCWCATRLGPGDRPLPRVPIPTRSW